MVHFKYTTTRPPQQSSLTERGFTATLFRSNEVMHDVTH